MITKTIIKLLEMNGINRFHCDICNNTIYVPDLQKAGQTFGKNWSSLATEAEYRGVRFRRLGVQDD